MFEAGWLDRNIDDELHKEAKSNTIYLVEQIRNYKIVFLKRFYYCLLQSHTNRGVSYFVNVINENTIWDTLNLLHLQYTNGQKKVI